MVAAGAHRRDVEEDLAAREERHSGLDIQPLPPRVRERYARRWANVQAQFVDTPRDALLDADRLVSALMDERG